MCVLAYLSFRAVRLEQNPMCLAALCMRGVSSVGRADASAVMPLMEMSG